MESNRKRRGFLKGKLMPSYGKPAAKSSSSLQYPSSNVKLPMANHISCSNSSMGFLIQQDYMFAPPKPKVFMLPDHARDSVARYAYEEVHGMAGDDETVDARAATYISYVQERFKLERINSERMKHQDQMI